MIYEPALKILKMRTKMNLPGQGFQRLEH